VDGRRRGSVQLVRRLFAGPCAAGGGGSARAGSAPRRHAALRRAAGGAGRADEALEQRRGGSGDNCGSPIWALFGPDLGRSSGRGPPARWEAAGAVVRLRSALPAAVDCNGLDLGLRARSGPDLDLSGSGAGHSDELPLVCQPARVYG
jgi:hypothetical protein